MILDDYFEYERERICGLLISLQQVTLKKPLKAFLIGHKFKEVGVCLSTSKIICYEDNDDCHIFDLEVKVIT